MTIIMGIVLLFGSVAWAGEASVFDSTQSILIRLSTVCTGGCEGATPTYSAYLEARDCEGDRFAGTELVVTKIANGSPAHTYSAESDDTFKIHDNNLTSPDVSLSFDSQYGYTYAFCTDTGMGLHMMKFRVALAGAPPVDGVCGSSNGGSFYSIPTTNLCSSGTASSVSGAGPWTWTCTGNSGVNGSCSATKKVDGVCGSSDGGIFTSAPTTNLCSSGIASGVSGTGPWTWTCTGNSGINGSCSAQLQSTGGGSSDLIISTFGAPTSFSNGVPFSMSVTIKNQGSGAAGPFKVKFYFSTNTTRDSADRLLVTWDVPGLAPGQSLSYSTPSVAVSGTTHFYYYLIAVVDADSQVAETNESNNTKTRSMFCGN